MSAAPIFRPFILILTTIGTFAVVVSMLQRAYSASSSVASDHDINEMFGTWEFDLATPTYGVNVTGALVKDEMVHPHDAPIKFTDPDDGDIKYLQIIRNNTNYDPASSDMWKKFKDFISVQRETDNLVSSKWNGASIPLTLIENNFDWKTNMSIVGFDLSRKNDTLFVVLPANDTNYIWNDTYTLYYGLADKGIDFWATIGLIMTANVPGMNPVMALFLAGFFDFTLIFIAFVMIRSILPFPWGGD